MNLHTAIKNTSKLVGTNRASSQKFGTKSIEHSKAVNEAEKIIGCPATFLSSRWLFDEQVANVAFHLKKLIGTKHPLINTTRELMLKKESPSWGLIVLLTSKAGGLNSKFSQVDCDINAGDYLLSNSVREIAGLKCHAVSELLSTSLRDLAEADFIEPRDKQNNPLPALPLPQKEDLLVPKHFDKAILTVSEVLAEWRLHHLLGGAGLLGKCCQAALILADHSKDLEESAYIFGRNIALALQVRKDISCFKPEESGPFSLISAPLMFHIQDNVDFYKTLMEYVEKDDIKYDQIRSLVLTGKGIQKSLELKQEFVSNGLEALNKFPVNEAKNALINILETV